MNNKKTLTSLATASMVITQAGQMSVFAKGVTADPETPAEKEEVKVEKTQKELLEEKIKEAQEKVDAAKKDVDAKKAEADAAKLEAEKANNAYTSQNTVVQTGYDALNGYIDESLQSLLNEIADLEAKIAQMTVNLNAEQKASQEEEQDKNEAETNLANKKAELEDLQNQLAAMKTPEELEAEYNQATEDATKAQEATDTAQKEADEAQTALDTAQSDLTAKEDALNQARTDYESATAEVTEKQTAVDSAQALLDSMTDPDGMETAKAELETAKADLQTAQQKQTDAENTLASANLAYETAKTTKETAETNLANAQQAMTDAQNKLNDAKAKEQSAKSSLDAANAEKEKNEAAIKELNAKIATAQNEVNQAQTAYDKALNDFNSTMSPLEQAKKNLADFEAKYATELARLNQGSKGYFDSIGASAAVDPVFDKNNSNAIRADLASYTNMGQKDDATSLENMQASIAYMKECNEIRKKEGLPELKVSMRLMAIAQANANYAKTHMEHSEVYPTGENLAWGYGNANTAGSPFRGWYDEEKAEYDAGNHKFSDVGHYLNVVENRYTVTGFAVGTGGYYSTAHVQEFAGSITGVKNEVQMTVSEFERSFNNYYNNLKSVDSQHKTLQNAVNNASGSGSKDNTAVTNALNLLNAKKNVLTSLQNQKTAKENERAGLQNRVNQATTSYNQAVQNTKAANQKVEEAKVAKVNAENALNSAKAELTAKENARQTASVNVNAAKAKTEETQNKVNTLNDRINNWTANTEKAEKNLADAKDALAKAKTRKAQMRGTFDTATDEHQKASDVFNDAKTASDDANTRLATAKENLSKKDALRNAAKKAVDTYNTASAQVESLEADITKLADTITAKETEKAKADENIEALSADIEATANEKAKVDAEAAPLKNVKVVLKDVLLNGSKADISTVGNDILTAKLSALQVEVDKAQTLKADLEVKNADYQAKYNRYVLAQRFLSQAEEDHDKAMKALSDYLNKSDKNDKTETNKSANVGNSVDTKKSNGVNTATQTALGFYALSGVLGLAGVAFTGKHARKED